MTQAEATALWPRIQAGDDAARGAFIAAHADLPGMVAWGLFRKWGRAARDGDTTFEDFKGIGRIALCHAVDDFDPDREGGSSFRTYAVLKIRSRMFDYCRYCRRRAWSEDYIEDAMVETWLRHTRPPSGVSASLRLDLAAALTALNEGDRRIVSGYYLDGYTVSELSARERLKERHVEYRKANALARMRRYLGGDYSCS